MLSDDNDNVCCLNKDHFDKVREAAAYRKEYYPDGTPPLRVWLTVGGAGRTKGFQTVFKQHQKKNITKFILALLQKCIEYDLYGIDFDNQVFGQDDMYHYVAFLNQAVQMFDKYGKKVSITMRPGIWIPSLGTKVVDRVNLMAYDGPFARLEDNVKPAVKATIQAGVPPSSIVLGYPAYARNERNPNEVKTFAEIYYDIEKSKNPQTGKSIDDLSVWDGFVIDSPAAVREKAQYAKELGLKGIYMWEVSVSPLYPKAICHHSLSQVRRLLSFQLGQDKQDERFAPSGFLLQSSSAFADLPDPVHLDDIDKARDEL